jgi:hypothetical protein
MDLERNGCGLTDVLSRICWALRFTPAFSPFSPSTYLLCTQAIDLYLEYARLEPHPSHRLPWRGFRVFLSPSRQIPGSYFDYNMTAYLKIISSSSVILSFDAVLFSSWQRKIKMEMLLSHNEMLFIYRPRQAIIRRVSRTYTNDDGLHINYSVSTTFYFLLVAIGSNSLLKRLTK